MNNLVFTGAEFDGVVVDLSNNTTSVTTKRALLRSIYVNTVLSAHICLVETNGEVKLRIPASTAAGTRIDCGDMKMLGGITINPDDSATGELLVVYKEVP